jgi:hypothetical protein
VGVHQKPTGDLNNPVGVSKRGDDSAEALLGEVEVSNYLIGGQGQCLPIKVGQHRLQEEKYADPPGSGGDAA